MHIVGNRPQFIKLAAVSREIRKRNHKEIIIHTGQHYDENMSDVFFEELGIPVPDINLKIGSGSHAQMTAKAMIEIEKTILEYVPKSVILYGDTNSTLAAALVCAKLNVPFSHVEAGPRTYNKKNPEECNRIITDNFSELLFCPDEVSVDNLKREGIVKNVYFTGDVMFDTFMYCAHKNTDSIKFQDDFNLTKNDYILMTWHRQENTESKDRMLKIINFIKNIESKIIFPVHPRTRGLLVKYELYDLIKSIKNLVMIEPVGYLEMVELLNNCKLVLTDSGGLSKESLFGGVKCLFMLDNIAWKDLKNVGWIKSIDFDDENSINEALDIVRKAKKVDNSLLPKYYGSGNAAEKIVSILEEKDLI